MLSLAQIQNSYPPKLHNFPVGMLREYLQYLILDAIYHSDYAHKLVFMGGTAIRIVHANQRFSEDLDFDNTGLSQAEFTELSQWIAHALTGEGFQVEIKNTFNQAFHCYIKIPKYLYDQRLSGLPDQKIIIRIDTQPQNYDYQPETYLLDKFGVLANIKCTPLPLLLAQKIAATLQRKRAKGRDFFDVAYLISLGVSPDMHYLQTKLDLPSIDTLKAALTTRSEEADLPTMAADVKSFLFDPTHVLRVESFGQSIALL